MDLWRMALDLATEARDDIDKLGVPMTTDQKLAIAQIYATLSVAQELTEDSTPTPRPTTGESLLAVRIPRRR